MEFSELEITLGPEGREYLKSGSSRIRKELESKITILIRKCKHKLKYFFCKN